MTDAVALRFSGEKGSGPLAVDAVELHRAFETDKDGRTSIHVWVTARVTPPDDDYVSITADIDFALLYDDAEIGRCGARGLVFEAEEREPRQVKADSDLRIPLNAEIKHIAVEVDLTKVVHMRGKRRYALTSD